jgi:hypothetical protein
MSDERSFHFEYPLDHLLEALEIVHSWNKQKKYAGDGKSRESSS